MAAQVTTETWDVGWTHVTRNIRNRLTDNIFDEYPTLEWFKSSKAVEIEEGGSEIQEPLLYGKNAGQWFESDDPLNTKAVDGVTSAFFQWRFIAVPVSISMTEERKAAGHARFAKKLIETKAEQSMLTARDVVSAALFSSASGKAMLGFQDVIKDTPTVGSLGGIDQSSSAQSWFRNQTNASGGNFDDLDSENQYTGINSMAALFNNCSSGNTMPERIITTLTLYSEWQQINISGNFARQASDKAKGFDARKATFMGATVDFDRDCASGHMYMLNPRFLKLKILQGMNFAKTPFKEPVDQFAKVSFVLVGLQLVTNNPRRLGVVQFT